MTDSVFDIISFSRVKFPLVRGKPDVLPQRNDVIFTFNSEAEVKLKVIE